ncbi:MAG: hypothetical protein F4Z67_04325 [Synechococcus sp. SB0667_bin_8]|nr:hypothetical protein [Synechococcus sp. SB0667_bin_8]
MMKTWRRMAQPGWAPEQAPLQAKRADQQKKSLHSHVLPPPRQGLSPEGPGVAPGAVHRPVAVCWRCSVAGADAPAQLLVKIHIQIMDQLANQLRMEGHSTTFLKDYRLALVDVMARLMETYRNAMAVDQSGSQPPDRLKPLDEPW